MQLFMIIFNAVLRNILHNAIYTVITWPQAYLENLGKANINTRRHIGNQDQFYNFQVWRHVEVAHTCILIYPSTSNLVGGFFCDFDLDLSGYQCT